MQQTPCQEDPDLWFSDHARQRSRAAEICKRCPLQVKCAEMGLAEEFGVWGGVDRQSRLAQRWVFKDADLKAQAYAMREEGMSFSAIGRKIGVSHSAVSRLFKRECEAA